MIILGISPLDLDTNVSLLVDGHLVFAAAEERYSRVKQHSGFPHRALDDALNYTGIRVEEIDHVAYPFLAAPREIGCLAGNMLSGLARAPFEPIEFRDRAINVAANLNQFRVGAWTHWKYGLDLAGNLRKRGLLDKLTLYHHHKCHAANAYFCSGVDPCLAVCVDGYGTGLAASIWRCEGGNIQYLNGIQATDSVGRMYAKVTKALGFKPNRHEGKILGLAAYGDPDRLYSILKKRFVLEPGGRFRIYGLIGMRFFLERLYRREPREDIAAVMQRVLEETIVHFVKPQVEKTGIGNVALSGGVVANVKLNQRIAECAPVERVFVFPGMTDVGTGVGASLLKASELGEAEVHPLETVLLGRGYSEAEILEVLKKGGYRYRHLNGDDEKISDLIIQGKVVAYFDSRMEFGPRALGSRSILVRATEPDINQSLNDRLRRTEFMPFAPVTPYELRNECYKNVQAAEHAARFMTMTFDCTPEMIRQSPAAVHVDGTARPQLICEEFNPRYYRIVKKCYEKSGLPSIINTSFNMHEEPIVLTPGDAIRAFSDGRLDYLVLGPFLLSFREAVLGEEDPLLNPPG